jgi:predicted TIM-barrel fold metal-dependent hydrolase
MEHYLPEDFKKVEKIDAHIHVNTIDKSLPEQAVEDNFILISINVDAFDYYTIEQQQEFCLNQHNNYPDRFYYLTSFRVKGFEELQWQNSVIRHLKESFEKGAVGVKVWKNIGMGQKSIEGKDVFIDDPIFDPVFSYLKENGIPLTGHIGEPKSCWLPLDQMIMPGDLDYFSKNPEYHMYLHPESPKYEAHIEALTGMLKKNPDLVYVGAHLGSLEWSIDELAKFLDAFPLMSVDMAVRICYLQYQSVENFDKVYNFIIKYQDRLIYGSDIIFDDSMNQKNERKNAHEIWLRDWIYFNTGEVLTSPDITQSFRGLRLPKAVIDKIYSKNARRIYLKNQTF